MYSKHFVSIVVCRIHILDHLVQLYFFLFFSPWPPRQNCLVSSWSANIFPPSMVACERHARHLHQFPSHVLMHGGAFSRFPITISSCYTNLFLADLFQPARAIVLLLDLYDFLCWFSIYNGWSTKVYHGFGGSHRRVF